jgi:hypothetical protein
VRLNQERFRVEARVGNQVERRGAHDGVEQWLQVHGGFPGLAPNWLSLLLAWPVQCKIFRNGCSNSHYGRRPPEGGTPTGEKSAISALVYRLQPVFNIAQRP